LKFCDIIAITLKLKLIACMTTNFIKLYGKVVFASFILFFSSVNINPCYSQSADSLLAVWNNKSATDSARAGALADYVFTTILFSNPDSAIILGERLLRFSEDNSHATGSGRAHYLLGTSKYNLGDYDAALEHLLMSLRILEKSGPKKVLTSTYNTLGILHTEYADFDKAIEYHFKSMRIHEELGNANGVGGSLNNIGLIYYDLEDFNKALEFFKRSVAVRDSAGFKRGMAMPLNNIGGIYIDKEQYDSALVYFERSLTIAREIGDMNAFTMALLNVGLCYYNTGKLDKAIEYYNEGLAISETVKDKVKIATSLVNLSNVYMKKGEKSKAVDYNLRALQIAKELGAVYLIHNMAESLYSKYKETGDFRKSLEVFELSLQMRDSMSNQDNSRKVMQQQFQYENDKKEALMRAEQEKKDALAAAEIERKQQQRNLSFIGFGLMAAAAGVFLVQRNNIRKERNKSDSLLLNILPEQTAQELKEKGTTNARFYDEVTVMFTDFKGFTRIAEQMSPQQLVDEINECFSAFDRIIEKHGIEKIKTIGDSYMAVGGLPVASKNHAIQVVSAALEIQSYMNDYLSLRKSSGQHAFEVRIGIHTGPVVAGIVGTRKFQYDIWGDTVNTASRMESASEPGKVNISESTYQLISTHFESLYRGEIEVKNKGKLRMYFVTGVLNS
jgi:adenylate cyclase